MIKMPRINPIKLDRTKAAITVPAARAIWRLADCAVSGSKDMQAIIRYKI
jgi:hypothetical protein